jgi:hypothetical protein
MENTANQVQNRADMQIVKSSGCKWNSNQYTAFVASGIMRDFGFPGISVLGS